MQLSVKSISQSLTISVGKNHSGERARAARLWRVVLGSFLALTLAACSRDSEETILKASNFIVLLDRYTNINGDNSTDYPLSGECTGNGHPVAVVLTDDRSGDANTSLYFETQCGSGRWSGKFNVSELNDGQITIALDHSDDSGNVAGRYTSRTAKDTVPPKVSLDASGDIIFADALYYQLSGSCSENDNLVSVQLVDISDDRLDLLVLGCSSGRWSGSADVSSLENGEIRISISHGDSFGNSTQVTARAMKFGTLEVSIDPPNYINSSHVLSGYPLSGSCSRDGRDVVITLIDSDRLSESQTRRCVSGNWSLLFPIEPLADGFITITVVHSDDNTGHEEAAWETATKDTEVPVLSFDDDLLVRVTSDNSSNYELGGRCSETGRLVILSIAGLEESFEVPCTQTRTWNKIGIDLSSLEDSLIEITAEHSDSFDNQKTVIVQVAKRTSSLEGELIVSFSQVKRIDLSWDAVRDADYYKVFEDTDGRSGYSVIADNIAATSYSHYTPLWQRIRAGYLIRSCDSSGQCTDHAEGYVSRDLLTQAIGYFKASNSDADDNFGISVSLSDDGTTLAVGASGESSNATGINGEQTDDSQLSSGVVYLFTKNANDDWTQDAFIKASNTGASDLFGTSVSLNDDGTTLAVGARGEDSSATGINGDQSDDNQPGSGAVYLFSRNGNDWTQDAYIKASNSDAGDRFGNSVSLSDDGDSLAVGAYYEDSSARGINGDQSDESADNSGAVYLFSRNGNDWTQDAYIKASNSDANDRFGASISLSGDGSSLAVGATREYSNARGINGDQNNNMLTNSGAVYFFTKVGNNDWTQDAYIKASNGGAGDFFGSSVSLSDDGNNLAVGAYLEDSSATGINGSRSYSKLFDSGAVYLFSKNGNNWTQDAYIKASNPAVEDKFGSSVSLSDDGRMLAVGATGEASSARGIGGNQGDNRNRSGGAIYMFGKDNGVWSQTAYIKASNTGSDDQFGASIGLSGDGSSLTVGAYNEDSSTIGVGGDQNNNSAGNAGAVYLY